MSGIEIVQTGAVLHSAAQDLEGLLRESESEIQATVAEFESLSRQIDAMMELAARIVEGIDGGPIQSIVHHVRALETGARQFMTCRLTLLDEVLATVADEEQMLERLQALMRKQKSISGEIRTLSLLTRIEVARLGEAGGGFAYLAQRLEETRASIAEGTDKLAGCMDERGAAVEQMRTSLRKTLPATRDELARIGQALGKTAEEMSADREELARIPLDYQACVGQIANQIARIVSAIQEHDFTRQQIEHVVAALRTLGTLIEPLADGGAAARAAAPLVSAGLTVQACQLRSVHGAMGGWVSQLRRCVDAIRDVGAAGLSRIATMVLAQEQHLALLLERMSRLETECAQDMLAVDGALHSFSEVAALVSTHLEQLKPVRDRLQLLTFNSIVEAGRVGGQADAILELSRCIKRVAAQWAQVNGQAEAVRANIVRVAGERQSQSSRGDCEQNAEFQQAQAQAGLALQELRAAGSVAQSQALLTDQAAARLREEASAIDARAARLEWVCGRFENAITTLAGLRQTVRLAFPDAERRWDHDAIKAAFGAGYSSRIEMAVLEAALTGAPLPTDKPPDAGNACELF